MAFAQEFPLPLPLAVLLTNKILLPSGFIQLGSSPPSLIDQLKVLVNIALEVALQ